MNNHEGPLTEQTLNEVEQQLRVKFPQDYRDFVLRYNGGQPDLTLFDIQWNGQGWSVGWEQDDVDILYSIGQNNGLSVEGNANTYVGRVPADTLPIGSDPFNNQLLLGVGSTNFGNVYLWMFSHEKDADEPGPADYRNVGFVANSFGEFLDTLRESE